MLGTTGGPSWWGESAGISTAVLVGNAVYIVDCGTGLGRQLRAAGIAVRDIQAVFITHLHSDHVVDLGSLASFGAFELNDRPGDPLPIYGPGPRLTRTPVSPQAETNPQLLYPEEFAPGISGHWDHLLRANATDLNDRVRDSLRRPPKELFRAIDIEIPQELGFHPDSNPEPAMEPLLIHEDHNVRVTAVLVRHPPMAPAFAYRFDTEKGSVTISGDTAPSSNLIRLAHKTDLLLHEVIDEEWVYSRYNGGRTAQEKSMVEHHLSAHTSIPELAKVATAAGAHSLGLHHFVPPSTPTERWAEVGKLYAGSLHIGHDLLEIPLEP